MTQCEFKTGAVIPAAGFGKRMGSDIPKQFLDLTGKPILAMTLERFNQCECIDDMILVVPEDGVCSARHLVDEYRIEKVMDIVIGGKERQDSVFNGFQKIDPNTEIVVVHDGVRPFISPFKISETVQAAASYGAAIVAVPEKNTVKQVADQSLIVRTVPRDDLWCAQTPQCFRYELLSEAFTKASEDGYYGTDTASLLERIGRPVRIVEGFDYNIKITTPPDLVLAQALIEQGY